MRRVVMADPAAWKFTRRDYHRLAEVGILGEDRRTELIGGDVLLMVPIGSRHAATVSRLSTVFGPLLGETAHWVQSPIALGDHDEPCPDFCLVDPRSYDEQLPRPADVRLVVEVAMASRDYDRDTKGPLYAGAGIREYWLVDLAFDRIEVARDPGSRGCDDVRVLGRGEFVAPLAWPHLVVAVASVLGPESRPKPG